MSTAPSLSVPFPSPAAYSPSNWRAAPWPHHADPTTAPLAARASKSDLQDGRPGLSVSDRAGTGVPGRRLSAQHTPTPTQRRASSDDQITVSATGVLQLLDHVCGTCCQSIYGCVTVSGSLNGCSRPICLVFGTAALCDALVRSVVYKSSYLLTYLLTPHSLHMRGRNFAIAWRLRSNPINDFALLLFIQLIAVLSMYRER